MAEEKSPIKTACAKHALHPTDPKETHRISLKLVHVGSKTENGGEGNKTYMINLEEYGQEVMMGHLIDAAERLTGVPFSHMKLIHKGRSLTGLCPKRVLLHEGITSGAKIMMIGRKPIPSDVVECKRLMELEASVDPVVESMHDAEYELNGIELEDKEKGHLSAPLQADALRRIRQKILGMIEWYMKTIEVMDGIQLDKDSTGARVKRKLLIARIQDHLAYCDKLIERIDRLAVTAGQVIR